LDQCLPQAMNLLDGFFAEEVLQSQPERVKDCLLMTSLFRRFNWSVLAHFLCGHATTGAATSDGVSALEREELFVVDASQGDGSWFRYHPLFRAFLQRTLTARIGGDAVKALQHAAARAWELTGNREEAVGHYLAAGKHGRASEQIIELVTAQSLIEEPDT